MHVLGFLAEGYSNIHINRENTQGQKYQLDLLLSFSNYAAKQGTSAAHSHLHESRLTHRSMQALQGSLHILLYAEMKALL